jgi:hypothetical protein
MEITCILSCKFCNFPRINTHCKIVDESHRVSLLFYKDHTCLSYANIVVNTQTSVAANLLYIYIYIYIYIDIFLVKIGYILLIGFYYLNFNRISHY